MSLIKIAVRNPVVSNLFMVAIIVLGTISFFSLPREIMPEIKFNWVLVVVPYPGVAPEEIERRITIPIEDEIQDVAGLDFVISQSQESSAVLMARFQQMSDEEFRARFQELRAEIDQVENLPEAAETPIVRSFTSTDLAPVITVHVHGDLDERHLAEFTRELQREIIDVSGVSKAELLGVRDKQIWVELDPAKLSQHALSPGLIRAAIAAHNTSVPAGGLAFGREELLVRTRGQIETVEDLREVIVRAAPGAQAVTLEDVATVREGFEREKTRSRLNRRPSMSITISKRPFASSTKITEEIRALAERFEKRHSGLVEVSFTLDTSEHIARIMTILSNNAWTGFLIVVAVLLLVLGFRNALLAALGIPISFLACFIFMSQTGRSLNGNSLFGLVLVLGVIVDDAIIIVENCYRHVQMGKDWVRAAIEGTEEVALPVLSATMTTLAAFLPLMMLPGIVGDFLRIIPITVSLALLASLVEAFVILPVHFAEWPGKHLRGAREKPWLAALKAGYERLLTAVIRWRLAFVLGVVLILVPLAGLLIPYLGIDLYAAEEVSTFQVRMTMPPGTSLETTSAVLAEIEEQAAALPADEVRAVSATAGMVLTQEDWIYRTDVGQVWLDLTSYTERKRTIEEIMADLRKRLAGISGPTSVELVEFNVGPPVGKPVEVKVEGKSFEKIEEVAELLQTRLSQIDGVLDIGDDYAEGKREMRFQVDSVGAAAYGLTVAEVGMALRTAVDGVVADVMFDEDEDVEILVKMDRRLIKEPRDLLEVPIPTPSSGLIPLGAVAKYTVEPTIYSIKRYKGERAITVFAGIDESKTGTVEVMGALADFFEEISPRYPGVSLDFTGEFQEFKESFSSLIQLTLLGVLLIYVILGAQFRSYVQPLVILFTVPFSFVGAIFGLLVSGNAFSVITMFGIAGLAGIAVNDAIVLIAFINRRREDGVDIIQAVIEGARTRLRPILLTSVTTIAGLLPMALGIGGLSTAWSPLATTIAWGLFMSTLLTIFIIPALYVLVDDAGRLFGRKVSTQVEKSV